MSHHFTKKINGILVGSHTVNGDGDCLGQLVAISADKGGNFAQRVELEIVLGELMWWFRVDYVEIELVGLGYYSNCSGTYVSL